MAIAPLQPSLASTLERSQNSPSAWQTQNLNSSDRFKTEGIDGTSFIDSVSGPRGPGELEERSSFASLLENTLHTTNSQLHRAHDASTAFANGESDDIHGTMLAVSQAEIQLKLMGSLRTRVLDAFNEIWRMQI
ncbi:MAG: flagellar hook-basal body complex protein FliE [Polyangiaceae bacterium]|nr:flagellar hook-basal body complex protein FliE [Polyangiaceae bacterium]